LSRAEFQSLVASRSRAPRSCLTGRACWL